MQIQREINGRAGLMDGRQLGDLLADRLEIAGDGVAALPQGGRHGVEGLRQLADFVAGRRRDGGR